MQSIFASCSGTYLYFNIITFPRKLSKMRHTDFNFFCQIAKPLTGWCCWQGGIFTVEVPFTSMAFVLPPPPPPPPPPLSTLGYRLVRFHCTPVKYKDKHCL